MTRPLVRIVALVLALCGPQASTQAQVNDYYLEYVDDQGMANGGDSHQADWGRLQVRYPASSSGHYVMPLARTSCRDLTHFLDLDPGGSRHDPQWGGWEFLMPADAILPGPKLLENLFDYETKFDYVGIDPVDVKETFNKQIQRARHNMSDSQFVHNWFQPLLYPGVDIPEGTAMWRGFYHRWWDDSNGPKQAWRQWSLLVMDQDPNVPELISFSAWSRHLIIEQADANNIDLGANFFESKLYADLVNTGMELEIQTVGLRGDDFEFGASYQGFPTTDTAGTTLPGLGGAAPHKKNVNKRVKVKLSDSAGDNPPLKRPATLAPPSDVVAGTKLFFYYPQCGGTMSAEVTYPNGQSEWLDMTYEGWQSASGPVLHGDLCSITIPLNAPIPVQVQFAPALITRVSTLDSEHVALYPDPAGWNEFRVVP